MERLLEAVWELGGGGLVRDFSGPARRDCSRDAKASGQDRNAVGAEKTRQTDPQQFPNSL
jgi:hypothetical protein